MDGRRRPAAALLAGAVTVLTAGTQTASASGPFVEDVRVLHTFTAHQPGGLFGWAISELTDVDGDGVTDAVIGHPNAGADDRGRTVVVSGRTGATIMALRGRRSGENHGYAMADAGDADGDGVADVIVGAPAAGAGHAYLYSGADGRLLHTFHGARPGDQLGAAVAGAGDVNNDGHADVLVGAPGDDRPGVDAGRVFVFSGRTHARLRALNGRRAGDQFGTAVDSTADVTGDGRPDAVVGAIDAGPGRRGAAYVFSARKHGRLVLRILPPRTGVDFGWFFVAGVGDTSGDGVPDVYVGDFDDASRGTPGTGRAGVYSGVDGSLLHAWRGAHPGAGMGPGREAGDVDGDGLVDLAVGSYTSDAGAPGGGRIDIFSGADGSRIRSFTGTAAGANLGFDAVGLGDVDGDGAPDLLASAASGETVYILAGRRR